MRKITVIPQTKNIFSATPISSVSRRKVAGYARVSTDSDEQYTSYEAQVEYYTNYIKSNPRWEFVGVYTDEGISGLNTKHREGFNQMIAYEKSSHLVSCLACTPARFGLLRQ